MTMHTLLYGILTVFCGSISADENERPERKANKQMKKRKTWLKHGALQWHLPK